MTIGWVASSTRGRSLAARLVGVEGARVLSRSESWPQTREALSSTIYGRELEPQDDRNGAHRAVASTTCWYLRVLAGWLPANAAGLARLMAGPLEIANTEHHLARLDGVETLPPVDLGSLAVAWPRVAAATSVEQVRIALARSSWGDPGSDDTLAIGVGLRASWLRRLASQVDDFGDAARGAAAVIVAREALVFGRSLPGLASEHVDQLLGRSWRQASTMSDLAQTLPVSARWAIDGLETPADVWAAELRVANRFAIDAERMAARAGTRRSTVAAVMMLLLVDRWRVDAALEVAGRSPAEVFDVMA